VVESKVSEWSILLVRHKKRDHPEYDFSSSLITYELIRRKSVLGPARVSPVGGDGKQFFRTNYWWMTIKYNGLDYNSDEMELKMRLESRVMLRTRQLPDEHLPDRSS
jgi:hypothetical protein